MSVLGAIAKAVKNTGKDLLLALLGGTGKNKVPKGQANEPIDTDALSKSTQVLGMIYKTMQRAREDQISQMEIAKNFDKTKESDEEDRNNELIKALTLKRKPKKKEPPKKEPPKEEKPKPTTKKDEGKGKPTEAKPTKTTEKPVEAKPAEKPTAEKVTPKETPKVPEKKVTEVKPEVAKPSAEKAPVQLGRLSSKFETGGAKNAAALVGWDSTGGTSYGTYQIAAKVGTMDSFLAFAQSKGQTDIVSRLKSAGPADTGSKQGPFVDEWKKISAEKGKDFENLQHAFIEESQYKPAAKALLKATKYDIEKQPDAIKDVFFSTVVQHGQGGAKSVFTKALEKSGGPDSDPKTIISNVYEIRATKFSSSTEKVRESVQKRFVQEKSQALDMLNNNGSKIDQASKENKDMKKAADVKQQINVNNNSSTQNQSTTSQPAAADDYDDRNPHQKK